MANRRDDISVGEIAKRLVPEGRRLVQALALPGKFVGPKFVSQPKAQGGLGQSFEVILDGHKRGKFFHNAAGKGGDFLSLIQYVRGGSIGDAVRYAKSFLGIEDGKELPAPKPLSYEDGRRAERKAEARRHRAGELWHRAVALDGTQGEAYLRSRGLRLEPWPATIRFAPKCWHDFERREFPALVAFVADAERRFLGVWRIFLDPEGAARKAPVEKPKLGLGECAGGAVRLSPLTGARLDTAEGLETSCAVLQRFPHLTVWASLSTSGMRGLVLPPAIKELVLWADRDPEDERQWLEMRRSDGETVQIRNPMWKQRPGTAAAEARAEKARGDGVLASIVHPGSEDGTDFANVFAEEASP